jgi:hypothetical protein
MGAVRNCNARNVEAAATSSMRPGISSPAMPMRMGLQGRMPRPLPNWQTPRPLHTLTGLITENAFCDWSPQLAGGPDIPVPMPTSPDSLICQLRLSVESLSE